MSAVALTRPTPAMLNTARTQLYPILSLPSHLAQPSSPSVPSRSSKKFSATSPHSASASYSAAPSSPTPAASSSRWSRFLASLLPLSPAASPADRDRVRHRVMSHLSLSAADAQQLSVCLSDAELEPLVSLLVDDCELGAEAVSSLMTGLSSHSSLQSLSFQHCGRALDVPAVLASLRLFPALTSLSLWRTDLSGLHKSDAKLLLALPALTELNLSSSGIPLTVVQSIVSCLSSPSSQLRSLDLSNTGCDSSVVTLLSSALAANARLSWLALNSNSLTSSSVLSLCSALASNSNLTFLDLRWNCCLTPPAASLALTAASQLSALQASAPLSLDLLLSSLQSNSSLLTLLLCGHADPFTHNLQSAVDLFLARNRLTLEAQAQRERGNTAKEASCVSVMREYHNPLHGARKHTAGDASHLSPGLSRSPSSSGSPLSGPLDSATTVSAAAVLSGAGSSGLLSSSPIDARLSSVVLQQEEEIARQGKIISRLRVILQHRDTALKTAKTQMRRHRGGDASPSPPSLSVPHPHSLADPAPALALDDGHVAPAGGSASMAKAAEEEAALADGGSAVGEFRVNLDLAATVVMLETENAEVQRELEDMRQQRQQQLQPAPVDVVSAAPASQQSAVDSAAQLSASAAATAAASAELASLPSDNTERGKLIREVVELRSQQSLLQQQLQQLSSATSVSSTAGRRDSSQHWAAMLASLRAETDRVLREKDEKLQSLLSAQRVLAESREVAVQAMVREWREKEREWTVERERMREEARRLRRRLNRLSQEPPSRPGTDGGSGSRSSRAKAAAQPVQLDAASAPPAGREEAAIFSPPSAASSDSESSSESSSESEPSSAAAPLSPIPPVLPPRRASAFLSSSQPISASSSSSPSAPPTVPHKPPHSLGMVIAARIAAFEAKRGDDSDVIRERMGMQARTETAASRREEAAAAAANEEPTMAAMNKWAESSEPEEEVKVQE